MCEKRNKIIKTIARPTPITMLCIDARTINAIKIIFPKRVSNKLTKILGTANITSHNVTNKVKRPTIKFCVFLSFKENDILYIM
jgi:hypothetical protein